MTSEMSRADAKNGLDDVARDLRAECLRHPGLGEHPKIKEAWARIGAAYMALESRADAQPDATGALPTFRELRLDAKPADGDVVDDAPAAWVERHRNDWKTDGGKKKPVEPDDDEDDDDDDADPEADEVEDAKARMLAKAKNAWKPKRDESDPPCPDGVAPDSARGNVTKEMADDVVEAAKAAALEKSRNRWKENPARNTDPNAAARPGGRGA